MRHTNSLKAQIFCHFQKKGFTKLFKNQSQKNERTIWIFSFNCRIHSILILETFSHPPSILVEIRFALVILIMHIDPSLALHRGQIELLLVEGILCLRLGPWLSHLPAERRLSLIDWWIPPSVIPWLVGIYLALTAPRSSHGGCFL